jgi:predicted polyphosphate/ATP-dependent NAD kinase
MPKTLRMTPAGSIGLVVNPIAGLGGRVGLKGTDGETAERRALELGAVPEASNRAATALQSLHRLVPAVALLVAPGSMGEAAAKAAGVHHLVVGSLTGSRTSAADTRRLARDLRGAGAELLLFAGGDGTARDVESAVGTRVAALGIPAGVKIHSSVFAVDPRAAGEIAAAVARGISVELVDEEVVDFDEDAYRAGRIELRLHGVLQVPHLARLVQSRKVPSPSTTSIALQEIAIDVAERVGHDVLVLGPGTTTRAIAQRLGVAKTLVGVDVIDHWGLVASDVNEKQLIALAMKRALRLVISPTGGQGFLFGRGNQQISPAVIKLVGRDRIEIVCAPAKLAALGGRPLLIDTGDSSVDAMLAGYFAIVTGYGERTMYRVATPEDSDHFHRLDEVTSEGPNRSLPKPGAA